MKSLFFAFLVIISAGVAQAKTFKSLCGADLKKIEIRLKIELSQSSPFSPVAIEKIDGIKPKIISGQSASGFGYRNYESIKLNLSGCEGTATYKFYNQAMPMNPMTAVNLICICSK